MALLKICRCGKKIDYNTKYCQECMVKVKEEKKDRAKRYDRDIRYSIENKKYADFYNSKAWRLLVEALRIKYNGLCALCLIERDEVVALDVIHHIVELKEEGGWELRLVEDNLIALCHECHNDLHIDYSEKEKLFLKKIYKKWEEVYGASRGGVKTF